MAVSYSRSKPVKIMVQSMGYKCFNIPYKVFFILYDGKLLPVAIPVCEFNTHFVIIFLLNLTLVSIQPLSMSILMQYINKKKQLPNCLREKVVNHFL